MNEFYLYSNVGMFKADYELTSNVNMFIITLSGCLRRLQCEFLVTEKRCTASLLTAPLLQGAVTILSLMCHWETERLVVLSIMVYP